MQQLGYLSLKLIMVRFPLANQLIKLLNLLFIILDQLFQLLNLALIRGFLRAEFDRQLLNILQEIGLVDKSNTAELEVNLHNWMI